MVSADPHDHHVDWVEQGLVSYPGSAQGPQTVSHASVSLLTFCLLLQG